MFFGTLLFLCCAALLVHNWWLARGIRLLEHQVAWASLDKQAWMRFLLSGQTPVIEPCTGFSKLVEALWAGYISRRVSAQMRTTLESAIAQLPTKCVSSFCLTTPSGYRSPTCLPCGQPRTPSVRILAFYFVGGQSGTPMNAACDPPDTEWCVQVCGPDQDWRARARQGGTHRIKCHLSV